MGKLMSKQDVMVYLLSQYPVDSRAFVGEMARERVVDNDSCDVSAEARSKRLDYSHELIIQLLDEVALDLATVERIQQQMVFV